MLGEPLGSQFREDVTVALFGMVWRFVLDTLFLFCSPKLHSMCLGSM
jgi:hypothetical protein